METVNLIQPKRDLRIQASKQHFKDRFYQRMGYILTEEKFKELTNHTRNKGVPNEFNGNRQTYQVTWEGSRIFVVANVVPFYLVTILTMS